MGFINQLISGGGSIVMGVPQRLDGFFQRKSQSKMDDDWGYPNFRKPPYRYGMHNYNVGPQNVMRTLVNITPSNYFVNSFICGV